MGVRFSTSDLEWHARKLAKLAGEDPDAVWNVSEAPVASMTIPDTPLVWEKYVLEAVRSCADQQLIDLWEQAPKTHNPSPVLAEIKEQLEKRGIDF